MPSSSVCVAIAMVGFSVATSLCSSSSRVCLDSCPWWGIAAIGSLGSSVPSVRIASRRLLMLSVTISTSERLRQNVSVLSCPDMPTMSPAIAL